MKLGVIVVFAVLAIGACGGKTVQYACIGQGQAGDQMCTPPDSMPFCCPDSWVCGTGSLSSGGNGCPIDECCPSPVADGGAE